MSTASETLVHRRQRVRHLLNEARLDALLVTGEQNVRWLSGFTGDSTWLLVTGDSEILLSDFRFRVQIEEECPGVASVIRDSSQSLFEVLAAILSARQIGQCGVESHLLTVEALHSLQQAAPGTDWVSTSWEIEQLRAVKDAGEIAEIRLAIQRAEQALDCLKTILSPQRTERELATELEYALRGLGASGFCFPAIVAVGDRAALPHYRPADRPVSASPILLIDWGARNPSGYCSDLTRTLLTGKSEKTFEQVYRTVLEAQQRAIAEVAPGKTCRELDAVARNHIQEKGYGQYFDHGLGHGIGLDVHELPRLNPRSETFLKPGMVVTVEPGIYLPGWGGVRIEDDVLVTEHGHEVLSSIAKDWESIHVSC
jgi:Xaa-Pro aminopeptidase